MVLTSGSGIPDWKHGSLVGAQIEHAPDLGTVGLSRYDGGGGGGFCWLFVFESILCCARIDVVVFDLFAWVT